MRTPTWLPALFAVAACVQAQPPKIQNARMENRAVAGGLESTFRAIVNSQSSPGWVGYSVPIVAGDRQSCCWNDNSRGCFLEPRPGNQTVVMQSNQTVKLEGPTELVVLYRIENKQVGKIRTFTPECELDAGGLPFQWLSGVSPAESVRLLVSLAKANEGTEREQTRKADSAIGAIAMHNDPAAEPALEEFVAATYPEQIRRQAIFWLGNARGARGYQVVSRVAREDPSDKIREHAVFALTQNKDPQALNVVVGIAHNDKSARVRGQALFWLAQRAGQKTAESAISDALANDPETEVKKKAVFALTQMPKGEGVPLLIQVAKTNRNPEVRKQAIFWLGQSKDERALTFIEDVLK